jgi:hypothetical protein
MIPVQYLTGEMMKTAFPKVLATLAVFFVMAAGARLAPAQSASEARGTAAQGAPLTPGTMQLEDTAEKATASIETSLDQKKALVDAVRSSSREMAMDVLLKKGFTARNFEGAGFVFNDNTSGAAEPLDKIHVSIAVYCCPVTYEITLR